MGNGRMWVLCGEMFKLDWLGRNLNSPFKGLSPDIGIQLSMVDF